MQVYMSYTNCVYVEVPGLSCPGRETNPGEHSRKEPFELEQIVNSYSEHIQYI
jgi:hypothetical protein